MPGRIDAGRQQRVVAHVYLLDGAVVGNQCATMCLTGMKLHAVGVALLIAVAVDTLATALCGAKHIIYEHLLVEVLQAALVQGELLIGNI